MNANTASLTLAVLGLFASPSAAPVSAAETDATLEGTAWAGRATTTARVRGFGSASGRGRASVAFESASAFVAMQGKKQDRITGTYQLTGEPCAEFTGRLDGGGVTTFEDIVNRAVRRAARSRGIRPVPSIELLETAVSGRLNGKGTKLKAKLKAKYRVSVGRFSRKGSYSLRLRGKSVEDN